MMNLQATANDRQPCHVPEVELVSLAIAVRWRRPTIIPGAVVANVLRGALGITFRKLVCPAEWLDHPCAPCPMYSTCAYGLLFNPTPPDDAAQLRLQQDLPRPFVIEPPGLHPDTPATPEQMTFALTLFGQSIDHLPYFITTLERLGRDGLGRDRVPFDVESITARHPAGNEVLFTSGATVVRMPLRRLRTADILETTGRHVSPSVLPPRVAPLPAGNPWLTVKLRFLTPTLLRTGSGIDSQGCRHCATEVRGRPPFGVVARRLRDRLSTLCAFFGEPWRHPDFAALGTAADTVRLVDSHTVWLTRHRRSTRTGDTHEISGFVGEAVYEFPDAATRAQFLPLLKLAEYIHVGKYAPWGHGKVLVEGDAG
jgi:hypothetical protein